MIDRSHSKVPLPDIPADLQSLRKHRVELIFHAEPLANDDTGDMFRKFIGIVNEYQSKETARATILH